MLQKQPAPVIAATNIGELNDEQLAAFHKQGFAVCERISPPEEVAALLAIFRRLFEDRKGWKQGAMADMVSPDDDADAPMKLPQILRPSNLEPELLETHYHRNAFALAKQLLGPEAEPWIEHAILKPPNYGAPTPWHQDEATRTDPDFAYEQISVWMPLQDADEINGCLAYIPGTHRGGVLPHRSPNDDPRVLAVECAGGFDPADAIVCPVKAGGAVIHHGRTLHHAGPNRGDVPRYAYILGFRTPPVPAEHRDFYWNKKQAAIFERRKAWENRYGLPGRALRKAAAFGFRAAGKVARTLKPGARE